MRKSWSSSIVFQPQLPLLFLTMGLLLLIAVICFHSWINNGGTIGQNRYLSSSSIAKAASQDSLASAVQGIIADGRNVSNFPEINDNMAYTERLFYLDKYYRSSQGFITQE